MLFRCLRSEGSFVWWKMSNPRYAEHITPRGISVLPGPVVYRRLLSLFKVILVVKCCSFVWGRNVLSFDERCPTWCLRNAAKRRKFIIFYLNSQIYDNVIVDALSSLIGLTTSATHNKLTIKTIHPLTVFNPPFKREVNDTHYGQLAESQVISKTKWH